MWLLAINPPVNEVGKPLGFDSLVIDLLAGGNKPASYPWSGYWLDIGRARTTSGPQTSSSSYVPACYPPLERAAACR